MRTIVLLLACATFAVPNLVSAQQRPDMDQVKAANQSYYDALSSLDMKAMEKVWARSSVDTNIAPPVRPVPNRGWGAVKKGYDRFWSTLEKLTVSMEQPTITIHESVAWVYGIEKAQRKLKDGQEQAGSNMGTSIFVKQDGRWLMVFHQAAAIPK